MRFMMIVKASKESEAGQMPGEELIASMGKYNEELMSAGALIDASGLQPSSKGARVRFWEGKTTVVDGPFAETKELIAGYWVINAESLQEAVAWARKAPAPHGPGKEAEIEVRQYFEAEDFPPSAALERELEMARELARRSR